MQIEALVVGATGIVGRGLCQALLDQGASVQGVSRHSKGIVPGTQHVSADLLTGSVGDALSRLRPTHVYLTTWVRGQTEQQNIEVNAGIVRTVLHALSEGRSVKHVALCTGLKHYLGPFDAYVRTGALPLTPVREEHPRLDTPNFYYAQEDELYAAAKRDGFTWSVHRPHTVIGEAVGNAMNMGSTLAVYASICKEIGRPFKFPGSAAQWNGITDMTDARVLGKHLVWASTHDAAKNDAYNVANGDVFRWNWMWPRLASWFGVESAGFQREPATLEVQMRDDGPVWKRIVEKHNLAEPDLDRVASPWHTDLDLGRPIEVTADMGLSRTRVFSLSRHRGFVHRPLRTNAQRPPHSLMTRGRTVPWTKEVQGTLTERDSRHRSPVRSQS